MQKYECIKELVLQKFDEEGASLEGETLVIDLGTGWEKEENSTKFVATSDAVRLTEIYKEGIYTSFGRWIEIHEDTLETHFKKLD